MMDTANHTTIDEYLGFNDDPSFYPQDCTFSNEDVPAASGFSSYQQTSLNHQAEPLKEPLSDSIHDASHKHQFIQDLLDIAAPALESHHAQRANSGIVTPPGMPSPIDYSHVFEVLNNNNNASTQSHHLGPNCPPDKNNYTTSSSSFSNAAAGSTSRVDENHLTSQWQQPQHFTENKLPYSQNKMMGATPPTSKRLSIGMSLDEVEALLNLETFNTSKKTTRHHKNRRSSANLLEPLLSCIQSSNSLSHLLNLQDESSSNSNFMEMSGRANASFDNNGPNIVTPNCVSKRPSLLSSVLDQIDEQDLNELGAHLISSDFSNTDLLSVSPYDEVTSSLPPMRSNTAHCKPLSLSQSNPVNPLDVNKSIKLPFNYDISFATRYRSNLNALVSRMEQTSKSRNALEEVKRHLNYIKKEVDIIEQGRPNIYDGQMSNVMNGSISPTTSIQHFPHYSQQNSAPLSYTAIKHSRRQQKSKKKRERSPTKSSQVTMKKKKMSDLSCSTHSRSFSLKLCTPEKIFG